MTTLWQLHRALQKWVSPITHCEAKFNARKLWRVKCATLCSTISTSSNVVRVIYSNFLLDVLIEYTDFISPHLHRHWRSAWICPVGPANTTSGNGKSKRFKEPLIFIIFWLKCTLYLSRLSRSPSLCVNSPEEATLLTAATYESKVASYRFVPLWMTCIWLSLSGFPCNIVIMLQSSCHRLAVVKCFHFEWILFFWFARDKFEWTGILR